MESNFWNEVKMKTNFWCIFQVYENNESSDAIYLIGLKPDFYEMRYIYYDLEPNYSDINTRNKQIDDILEGKEIKIGYVTYKLKEIKLSILERSQK